jgi:Skp family chaperone for outer membrane proteins
MRGPMKFKLKSAAAAILAATFVVSYASAQDAPAKKHHVVHHRERTPPGPTVEEQIETLRNQMQTQIDSLKEQLSTKDEQLQQAQQAAAAAQASADKAQAAVSAQQQAVTENSSSVSTLQSTVNDLKGNQASLASTISDETTAIKKEVENPDDIKYHGITLSPHGSFLAAETVWRSSAMGDGLNTHFSSVPLNNSQAAQIGEWQGSGRQSRVALKATGKDGGLTLTGYYEADWLSAGATSNNNQSNSYTMRMRQLWAEAKLDSGWTFSGGQGWSLATETTQGLQRGTEILPASIDPQYVAGFVWTRQYSFRVSKDWGNKVFLGVSAENAETLSPAGSGLPSNYTFGVPGDGGGLYNSANTYSSNPSPDFVIKMAFEPGWGHWEVFNIDRFFQDRVYPTASNPYNNTVAGSGIGGGFRVPLGSKNFTLGLKGLYGEGMGRYGSTTIADVTVRSNGTLAPLRAFSALSTLEASPTKRLMLYFNYGGDYVYRTYWWLSPTTAEGYGVPGSFTNSPDMSGCNTVENTSGGTTTYNGTGNCKANTKDVQEFTVGDWYNLYAGPKGRLRFGLQYSWFERDLWSGLGGPLNPGGGARGNLNTFYTSFRYYMP